MIKVTSLTPMMPQQIANGHNPAAPPYVPPSGAPAPIAYTNTALRQELPEVNEPERPYDGEAYLHFSPYIFTTKFSSYL